MIHEYGALVLIIIKVEKNKEMALIISVDILNVGVGQLGGEHGKNMIKISNFGTFILRYKKSRIGRNPKTKQKATISSRNVVLFKASKDLIKYINSEQ